MQFTSNARSTETDSMFGPSERRTLHALTGTDATRRILRAHLRPMMADARRAWLGGKLTPGVRGLLLGNHVIIAPLPSDRRLWNGRRSPTVLGKLAPRPDGGTDLRISVYTPGFPYRTVTDLAVNAVLFDWMNSVAQKLGAEQPLGPR